MNESLSSLAKRFLLFARSEADGASPLYAALARAVAGDEEMLAMAALAGPG